MEGAHDMGGVPWSDPVDPEPDEPMFHAQWERRAFAITLAMAMPGGWNIDMSRFAREDRPPEDYLGMSYYQIWLAGLERLMLERGLIAADEIEAGDAAASGQAGGKEADARGRRRRAASGRTDRPRGQEPCSVHDRRSRPDQDDSSADPYAAAALCARSCRHHRDAARRSRISRQQLAGATRIRNGSTP